MAASYTTSIVNNAGGPPAGNRTDYSDKDLVPTKLYVGSLPSICRKGDVQDLFEKFGKVVECDIVKDYGFVHFESCDDAKAAVAALNETEFEGSTITVQLSYSRVRQKPGMGTRGGCFCCGDHGHWSKDCPKGRSRGDRRPPPSTRDPYVSRYEPYYEPYPPRDRYVPVDRYRNYGDVYDRRTRYSPYPPPADPYARERDPYAARQTDIYDRERRDPYYEEVYRRREAALYRDRDNVRDYGYASGSGASGARSRGMTQ